MQRRAAQGRAWAAPVRPKAAHVRLAHVHVGVQPPRAPRAAGRPAEAAAAGRLAVAAAARAGLQRALAGRAPVAHKRARLRARGRCPGAASCTFS